MDIIELLATGQGCSIAGTRRIHQGHLEAFDNPWSNVSISSIHGVSETESGITGEAITTRLC